MRRTSMRKLYPDGANISSWKAAALRRWIRMVAFIVLISAPAIIASDEAHGGECFRPSGVSRPGDEPNPQGFATEVHQQYSCRCSPGDRTSAICSGGSTYLTLMERSSTVVCGLLFGRVRSSDNYADVRMGYSNTQLYVHLNIIDKQLWYDKSPAMNDLTDWNSVSLYLDLDGPLGSAPGGTAPLRRSPQWVGRACRV